MGRRRHHTGGPPTAAEGHYAAAASSSATPSGGRRQGLRGSPLISSSRQGGLKAGAGERHHARQKKTDLLDVRINRSRAGPAQGIDLTTLI